MIGVMGNQRLYRMNCFLGCLNMAALVLIWYMYMESTLQPRNLSLPTMSKPRRFDDFTGVPYLIPDDVILENLNETEVLKIYWRYINTIQTLCRNQSRFGPFRDGGKEVCLDLDYKPAAPCLVYSFGSNFDFRFDQTANHFCGCEVHTFDPTMDVTRGRIPKEINFHSVGLDGRDYVTKQRWKMRTLLTIMADLKHTGKILDIVKIDVEGSEFSAIPNIVESGVYKQIKQLLVEIHFGHQHGQQQKPFWGDVHPSKQLRALRLLYEHGFRIFMRDRVFRTVKLDFPPQREIMSQNEISLINIAFSPDKQ